MSSLDFEFKQMEILLQGVYAELKNITTDNFNDKILQIKKNLDFVNNRKKQLVAKYTREELSGFNGKLVVISKQIQKTVDNLIKEYETESLEIAQKLVQIGNRKKIANYLG